VRARAESMLERSVLAAFVMAIAGCATVDPARIHLAVDTSGLKCHTEAHTGNVHLTVRNDSRAKLKLSIDSTNHQPPYELNWLAFHILKEDGVRDWDHATGHGPMAPDMLSVDPGDNTELTVPFYELKPDDYARTYVIQIEDRRDHQFTTAPFKLCDVSQHRGRPLSR
jgi:hypothetical protein